MRRKGNLLIELLLSLFICSITFSLSNTLIIVLKHSLNTNKTHQFFEEQIAITQIRNEILSSNINTLKFGEVLTFRNSNNDIVSYKFYNNRLIKQINGSGFVILMFNIKKFNSKYVNNVILLEFITIDNNLIKEEIVIPYDY